MRVERFKVGFFTQSTVVIFNALPEKVIETGIITRFKRYLVKFMDKSFRGDVSNTDKWD